MSLWKAAHLAPEQSLSVLGSRECFLKCARHPSFLWDNKNAIPSSPKVALSFQVSSLPHCIIFFWLSHSSFQEHQQHCPAEITNVQHPQEILEEQGHTASPEGSDYILEN